MDVALTDMDARAPFAQAIDIARQSVRQ